MAIVTISHEMGAGGPEIGQQVAERLGYKYVDHELISDTARRYGLLEEKLEHLDETKPSLFERFDAETRRYITAMQTALYEFAEQDRVVLMGRGGPVAPARHPPRPARARDGAVRHPRQAARDEARRARWASRRTRGRSPRWCGATTRRRPGRMRYLYEVDVADPALYDLVVNTEKLPTAAAVDLIADVVRRPELQTTPAAAQIVADRSLASQVQVALATNPETRKYRITVEAKAGVVTLEGTAAMDEALDVAKSGQRGARGEGAAGRHPAHPPVRGLSAGPTRVHRFVGARGRALNVAGTTPRARPFAGAASHMDPLVAPPSAGTLMRPAARGGLAPPRPDGALPVRGSEDAPRSGR